VLYCVITCAFYFHEQRMFHVTKKYGIVKENLYSGKVIISLLQNNFFFGLECLPALSDALFRTSVSYYTWGRTSLDEGSARLKGLYRHIKT
jgi:hypothetical protein